MPEKKFVYGKILNHRVVDGDTLDLRIDLGHHVGVDVVCRLNGIDAPEKTTHAGILVKQYVSKWMDYYSGNTKWDSHSLDKYRRSLGEVCLFGEFDLNPPLTVELINEGLVRPYNGGKRSKWLKADLKRIERKALELVESFDESIVHMRPKQEKSHG